MDFDFWLIQKMKHGDESAFDIFVHKHYKTILNFCAYHCIDVSVFYAVKINSMKPLQF